LTRLSAVPKAVPNGMEWNKKDKEMKNFDDLVKQLAQHFTINDPEYKELKKLCNMLEYLSDEIYWKPDYVKWHAEWEKQNNEIHILKKYAAKADFKITYLDENKKTTTHTIVTPEIIDFFRVNLQSLPDAIPPIKKKQAKPFTYHWGQKEQVYKSCLWYMENHCTSDEPKESKYLFAGIILEYTKCIEPKGIDKYYNLSKSDKIKLYEDLFKKIKS
jgi:hypothetical protein